MEDWNDNLKRRPIDLKKKKVRRQFRILFVSFFVLCLVFGWIFYRMRIVEGWVLSPCVILSAEPRRNLLSKVAKISKGWEAKSVLWRVSYGYEYKGSIHGGERYTIFVRDYLGGVDSPALVGSTIKCYVNPMDPAKSVLWREYSFFEMLFYWPVPVSILFFLWRLYCFFAVLFMRSYGVM
jgi:hypothetical protein